MWCNAGILSPFIDLKHKVGTKSSSFIYINSITHPVGNMMGLWLQTSFELEVLHTITRWIISAAHTVHGDTEKQKKSCLIATCSNNCLLLHLDHRHQLLYFSATTRQGDSLSTTSVPFINLHFVPSTSHVST